MIDQPYEFECEYCGEGYDRMEYVRGWHYRYEPENSICVFANLPLDLWNTDLPEYWFGMRIPGSSLPLITGWVPLRPGVGVSA